MPAYGDRGDYAAATQFGISAVERLIANSGLGDDVIFLWALAVEAALVADDRESLNRLVDLVDQFPTGLVGIGFRAHRARIDGLIAIADGNNTDVETKLLDAITAFDAWGSPTYRARTKPTSRSRSRTKAAPQMRSPTAATRSRRCANSEPRDGSPISAGLLRKRSRWPSKDPFGHQHSRH